MTIILNRAIRKDIGNIIHLISYTASPIYKKLFDPRYRVRAVKY